MDFDDLTVHFWPVLGRDYLIEDEARFMQYNPLRHNPLLMLKPSDDDASEECGCVDAHVYSSDGIDPSEYGTCWYCSGGWGPTCEACALALRDKPV